MHHISRIRFLAATVAVISASSAAAEDWTIQIVPRTAAAQQLLAQNDEGPVITPLQKSEPTPAPPQPDSPDGETAPPQEAAAVPFDRNLYESIYNSIPFSRAEYVANPGYRHQATMSIILGQPYNVTPVGYEPQVLTEFPVKWRPGRTVFGYRPWYARAYWWGFGHPYWWGF